MNGRVSMLRVYPRVCGGAPVTTDLEDLHTGLSPRVRGSPHRPSALWTLHGSIPACAGEPGNQSPYKSPIGVYPRVCGGAAVMKSESEPVPGLSPRVRGSPLTLLVAVHQIGSIPACAGEPGYAYENACTRRVYPRVCGGAGSTNDLSERRKGLSPRVRGSRYCEALGDTSQGSIPACAGEPCRTRRRPPASRVYPRVCGGAMLTSEGCEHAQGLSPRVRGSLAAA